MREGDGEVVVEDLVVVGILGGREPKLWRRETGKWSPLMDWRRYRSVIVVVEGGRSFGKQQVGVEFARY